jgi:hypothetical protein
MYLCFDLIMEDELGAKPIEFAIPNLVGKQPKIPHGL